MKKIFVIFFFAFCFAACGSVDEQQNSTPSVSSNKNRPEWTNVAEKIKKADGVLFVGYSSGADSKEDALSLAQGNAFAKVSNSFGVAINNEINVHEVDTNGEYSYAIGIQSSVTGQQIEVKNYHIKDKYIEPKGRKYDAFILIYIPNTELARIQIEVDGFGIWALNSNIPESTDKIRTLFPIFNQKGIKLNEKIDFENAQDIDKLALESQKAFFFKIECEETKSEEYNGEFYSIVQIKAELFNLLTKETINRWTIETKGAAYSAKDARENAVSKAVQEIADQIK